MAKKGNGSGESGASDVATAQEEVRKTLSTATSLPIAGRGVNTSQDFRNLMSALMTDVIQGSVTPDVTNAACNAGGKLLKMVELEYKFASGQVRNERVLALAGGQ